MCKAVFKAIEKQLMVDEVRSNDMARDMLNSLEVGDDKTAERIYWDDVNGGWLNTKEVERARKKEMEYIKKMAVYSRPPLEECWRKTN